jgi:hypothetical protein
MNRQKYQTSTEHVPRSLTPLSLSLSLSNVRDLDRVVGFLTRASSFFLLLVYLCFSFCHPSCKVAINIFASKGFHHAPVQASPKRMREGKGAGPSSIPCFPSSNFRCCACRDLWDKSLLESSSCFVSSSINYNLSYFQVRVHRQADGSPSSHLTRTAA